MCMGILRQFEGDKGTFEAVPTKDPEGNWEIGWGHKLSGPGKNPAPGRIIDRAEADTLAAQDLQLAADGVCQALSAAVVAELTDGQYAALIDFTYNLGVNNFAGSTLCRLVNGGNFTLAADEFGKWVYATDPKTKAKVVLQGLVKRRALEKAMWLL